MSAKTVIYIVAALIVLYLLFDRKGFGADRVRKGVDWISSGFRKLWNPLIGVEK
jgi:hypothetical protein